ncbi:MAG: ribosomal protein S18-alanine N-acetyltransferase [Candidatus Methanofastidiosia archaeon]
MQIREVQVHDLRRIYEIEFESFQHPYPPHVIDFLFESHRETFLVAFEREVLGYVIGIPREEEGHIISLAVKKSHRRRRIGSVLVSNLLELFSDKKKATLEVRISNKAAIKLYEKLGFSSIGILKNYYENWEDAILMERFL